MKIKELDTVGIIMELEGGELILEDTEDLETLKNVCREFAGSQGFYGRLLRDLESLNVEDIEFPVVL